MSKNSLQDKILPERITASMRKASEADMFDATIRLRAPIVEGIIEALKYSRDFIASEKK